MTSEGGMGDICEQLHATWCRETRTPIPFDFGRRHAWEEWLRYIGPAIKASEWPQTTPEQLLVTVISRRRFLTKTKPEVFRPWVRFARITGSPDECVEDWCIAKAEARPRPQFSQEKAEVLRATGRPDAPEPPPARMAPEVLDSMLQKLREAAR